MKFNDVHLHFHDPSMQESTITDIIKEEFPHFKSFYDSPDDNSALLGMMDAIGMQRAWVINYESPEVIGYTRSTNDWVSAFCDDSDDRLIPIGGIIPRKGENVVLVMREYIESGKIRGLKVHGPHQLLYPNEYTRSGLKEQHDLYLMCEELKVPVMFHTGSSIFKAARSKYGNPLDLEDILIDFPDLTVIMCHGGRPFWQREAEYLMIKFPQLYMDIAGVPPKLIHKYFPRLERYSNRLLFGSDYPSPGVPSPRMNAEAIAELPLPDDVLKKILIENMNMIIK
ncbi:MAG: amidohydrolase [Candidatus Heimdallarchaeota archaeon]|nr:amidohydrolase [Candidatus Heimdallarchaeota archaeon]